MSNQINVMLDLETLGTNPGCKILSIGATVFEPVPGSRIPKSEFYQVINRDNQGGLKEDPDTLAWWNTQSVEAKAAIFLNPEAIDLHLALHRFAGWLYNSAGHDAVIWGNGATFDAPILSTAYIALGLNVPWKYYNERCFRTLKGLNLVPEPAFQGTKHNALADAKHQAAWAEQIFKELSRL